MGAINERLMLYSGIAILVIFISFVIAYLLSRTLQKQISIPILALAYTARAISDRHDYSVRARKFSEDELGLLTDAFNHMLGRIQEQTLAISEGETRVRAIINSAMSAVIVIDANGIITDWNARAEKMFGWPRHEALGRELAELIIPQQFREAHRNGIKYFLNTGKGPVLDQLLEMSALRSDGSEFPAELSISVMKTEDKIAFCGFVTDITERKQAEEEIRSFNLKLEQKVDERTQELHAANKELEAFSYSVSHDLRAPLRSIHGYMNIFSEEYGNTLDDEGKRLIDTVLRNGQKMGQLIDDLLAFSQLGRKELIRTPVSIKDMVSNIWEDIRRTEKNRTIQFNLHQVHEAFADQITIRQVWTNLISNAVKYTKAKDEAIIEIGSDDKGDELVYYIKDNGAGFDMKYYDKLFGVFQRLHSFHEFEGTGVGLAIVQRVISRHGGKIWAEAKVNEGATFYFSLKKE
jgi:PAS domain S-box-containing protein